MISLLRYDKIRKQYDVKVVELVDVGIPCLWGHVKNGLLRACDDVCRRKLVSCSKGGTLWWNELVKEAISGKQVEYSLKCRNSVEENMNRYKSIKNRAKNVVS